MLLSSPQRSKIQEEQFEIIFKIISDFCEDKYYVQMYNPTNKINQEEIAIKLKQLIDLKKVVITIQKNFKNYQQQKLKLGFWLHIPLDKQEEAIKNNHKYIQTILQEKLDNIINNDFLQLIDCHISRLRILQQFNTIEQLNKNMDIFQKNNFNSTHNWKKPILLTNQLFIYQKIKHLNDDLQFKIIYLFIKHGFIEYQNLNLTNLQLLNNNFNFFDFEMIFTDTLLHWAIKNDKTKIAQLLITKLNHNILNKQNIYGNTPLHLAILKNNPAITLSLINKLNVKELNKQNKDGNTPLHLAIKKANIEIIKILINKLDVKELNIQNAYGNTPLHLAIKKANIEIIKILINKLDVKELNIQNAYGNTPLHLAIKKANIEIIKILINKLGVEALTITNKKGNSPLDLAIISGNKIIIANLKNTITNYSYSKTKVKNKESFNKFKRQKKQQNNKIFFWRKKIFLNINEQKLINTIFNLYQQTKQNIALQEILHCNTIFEIFNSPHYSVGELLLW